MLINGEVYDVRTFADIHPGGKRILLQSAGTDATELFSMYHHEGVLTKYREKLKVGEIAGAKPTPVAVPFAQPLHFGQFRSPYYKDTHYKLASRVQRFVKEELLPTLDHWAEDSQPPRDLYLKMGSEGFLACLTGASQFPREWVDPGTPEPEDYDIFHEFIVIDLISQIGHPSAVSGLTNGPAIALTCIMKFGSDAQKQLVARDALMGRVFIALAMSEPNAGSDVAGLQCRATPQDGGWAINGVKKWITNAAYARYIVTAVVTNSDAPAVAGTSLLLVDTEAAGSEGLSIRKIALGAKANIAGTSFLEFDDVFVEQSMLIGQQDHAFKYLMTNLNHERLYFSTICNRIARVCMEECCNPNPQPKLPPKPPFSAITPPLQPRAVIPTLAPTLADLQLQCTLAERFTSRQIKSTCRWAGSVDSLSPYLVYSTVNLLIPISLLA